MTNNEILNIEMLCKNCKLARFTIIKSTVEIDDESVYWWCSECIIKNSRRIYGEEKKLNG